jgi:hypothetical protein
MSSLDDEIAKQNQAKVGEAATAGVMMPARYSPELTDVIRDFMGRGIPTDTVVPTGRKYPPWRLVVHLPNSNDAKGWTLFKKMDESMSKSVNYLVLTHDGLLRTFVAGRGFQPISHDWIGTSCLGPSMRLNDGSLTSEIKKVLASKFLNQPAKKSSIRAKIRRRVLRP